METFLTGVGLGFNLFVAIMFARAIIIRVALAAEYTCLFGTLCLADIAVHDVPRLAPTALSAAVATCTERVFCSSIAAAIST